MTAGKVFPNGLFWIHRPDSDPAPRVVDLIEKAKAAKIDAHIVEAETFDEIMADLFVLTECPEPLLSFFNRPRQRLSPAEIPPVGTSWPVIRFNAIPLTSVPSTCRRVVCEIGGTAEVREAIAKANAQVVAVRRGMGVIGFGSDAEVRKAFDPHAITEFDLHPIDPARLEFESAEHGLLNDSLAKAICRERGLVGISTRHGWKLYVDPQLHTGTRFKRLKAAAGLIVGTVATTQIHWAEAILIKIERRLGQTWLVFEPSIWTGRQVDADSVAEPSEEEAEAIEIEWAAAREFTRERAARRYNSILASLLDGWLDVLLEPEAATATVRTFGVGDGIDASFTVSRVTAFSRRGGKA